MVKRFTPSCFRQYWGSRARWLNEVLAAIDGKPVYWSGGEREAATKICAEFGITIITKTAAQRQGYVLRKNARPIGTGYFYSPIAAQHDLYILECHFDKGDE